MTTKKVPRGKQEDLWVRYLPLQGVPLEPLVNGSRHSSQDGRIHQGQKYLLKENGRWTFGVANKVWFGWSFFIGSHSVQLNSIEELYEVDFSALEV